MSAAWVPPEIYSASLPKSTVFACMLLTDQAGRLLQLRSVHHSGHELWQWPGGNLDAPSETPWQTAVRECAEETGIRIDREPRLLGMRFVAPRPNWPYSHIGFYFDGGALTADQVAAIRLDPAEHSAFELRFLHHWAPLMTLQSLTRVQALLQARATGVPAYLEARP